MRKERSVGTRFGPQLDEQNMPGGWEGRVVPPLPSAVLPNKDLEICRSPRWRYEVATFPMA